MKKAMFIMLFLASSQLMAAQKCISDGKTVYKQGQCPEGAYSPKAKSAETESLSAKQKKIEKNGAIAARNAKQEDLRNAKWKRTLNNED